MAQAKTKSYSMWEIMAMPAFQLGFKESLKNAPANFDQFYGQRGASWAYEYGRLIGAQLRREGVTKPYAFITRNGATKRGYRIVARIMREGAIPPEISEDAIPTPPAAAPEER